MGIFKDLGFKNRNGYIVAPDSERFGGFTLQEIVDSTTPKFINIDNTIDGQAIIQGTSLPTTISQAESWTKYQAVAYNLQDSVTADTNTSLMINGNDLLDKTGKVLTNNNATVDTSIKKFGIGSLKFNGTNSLRTPGFSDLALGTSDFTVECWGYLTSYPNRPQYFFGLDTTGGIGFGFESGYFGLATRAIGFEIAYAYTPTLNTWTHYAFSRQSGTMRLFINGILMTSKTNTKNFTVNTGTLSIGKFITGTYLDGIVGNIADLRISKGIARYTSTFTPPTYELNYNVPAPKKLLINNTEQKIMSENISTYIDPNVVLMMSGNDLLDKTGKTITNNGTTIDTINKKYGNGSLYFNGSSYLTIPTSTDFAFGTGDFTIEFWYKPVTTKPAPYGRILQFGPTWGDASTFVFLDRHNSYPTQYSIGLGGTNGVLVSNKIVVPNTWVYITIVKSNTNLISLYLDGVLDSTATYSGNFGNNTTNTLCLMSGLTGESYSAGNIDDLRITKGIARYTSNFTPPTSETSYMVTKNKTIFEKTLTNINSMSIELQGTVDTVEINFYEGE